MSDSNDDLTVLGNWITQNQHLQGTDEFNTIARAFQKLDNAAQQSAKMKSDYAGLGGIVKAGAGQVLPGVARGIAGLVDATNKINPIYPLWRGAVRAITGKDIEHMTPVGERAAGAVRDVTGSPEIKDLPEAVRPYAYGAFHAGDAFGSMAAPLGALGAIGKGVAAGTEGANLLNATTSAIAKAPGTAIAGTLPLSAGAGFGATAADTFFPDNETAHAVGSLAGSAVHPLSLLRSIGGKGAAVASKLPGGDYLVNKARATFDPEKATAGNIGSMYDAYTAKLGGNPDEMMLRAAEDLTSPLNRGPAHTRTLDPVVQDLVAHLGAKDVNTGRAFQQAADSAHKAMQQEAVAQIGGDASKLVPAVQQRVQAGTANIQDMLAAARARGQEAGSKLVVSPEVEANAGQQLNNMVRSAFQANKDVLNQVGAPFPVNANLGPQAANQWRQRWDRMPIAQELPSDTRALLDRVASDPTAGMYHDWYSQLRADARGLRSGQFGTSAVNQRAANFADDQANRVATMFDFRKGKNPGLSVFPDMNAAGRAMYDRFSRSAVNPLLSRDMTGAGKVLPELSAEKLLSGTDLSQTQKVQQAIDATGATARGPGAVAADVKAAEAPFAQTALETAQRGQLGRNPAVYDPATGLAKPSGVQAAFQREPGLYQQFPGLSQDMTEAAGAAATVARRDEQAAKFHAMLQSDKSGAGRILARAETPEGLFADALGKKAPEAYLDSLLASARRAGQDGVEGFNGALSRFVDTEHPLEGAMNIMSPVNSKSGTLADWMKDRGLISADQHQIITGEAKQIIENAKAQVRASAAAVDPTTRTPDYVDVASRIFGASMGNKLSGLMGGHTLISAQVGSKYARQLASSMGLPSQVRMLTHGVENPEDLANLLKVAVEQRQAAGVSQVKPEVLKPGWKPGNVDTWSLLLGKSNDALDDQRAKRPRGLLN